MTEKGVVRDLPFHNGLKRLDVVDPFSNIGALGEEVLIHVRNHICIRVESSLSREQLREPAAGCRGKRYRNSGLDQTVSTYNAPKLRIDHRLIERMMDRSDELLRDVTTECGIAIEGDDVSGASKSDRISHNQSKRGRIVPEEESVKLLDLSSFAFPRHPLLLARVPQSLPEEEGEADRTARSVPEVQGVDPVLRDSDDLLIEGDVLA